MAQDKTDEEDIYVLYVRQRLMSFNGVFLIVHAVAGLRLAASHPLTVVFIVLISLLVQQL